MTFGANTTVFLASSLCTASQSRGFSHRLIIYSFGFNPSFRSTDADVKTFMGAHVFLGATDAQVDSVANEYSQDPAAVSCLARFLRPSG